MNDKLVLTTDGPVVHGDNWLKLPPTQRTDGHPAEVKPRVYGMPELLGWEENQFAFRGWPRWLPESEIWDTDLDETERQTGVFTRWILVAMVAPDGECRFAAWLEASTGNRRLEWPADGLSAREDIVATSRELQAFALRLQNRLKAPLRSVLELDRRQVLAKRAAWATRSTRSTRPSTSS